MADDNAVDLAGVSDLAAQWWAIAFRGLAAVLFGCAALFWPPAAFLALVFVFGAYALVDGVLNVIGAVRAGRSGGRWGALVFEGVVSVIAGLVTLFWPGITALALVLAIAAWSFVTGIAEIAAAIRLRKQIRGEWLLGLSGLLSVAFGVLLFLAPAAGAFALTVWIGAYSLVFGAVLIGLAFRLRSLTSHAQTGAGTLTRQPA
jgi:uncharacterized membrane protein HdeD (DUF308 family)